MRNKHPRMIAMWVFLLFFLFFFWLREKRRKTLFYFTWYTKAKEKKKRGERENIFCSFLSETFPRGCCWCSSYWPLTSTPKGAPEWNLMRQASGSDGGGRLRGDAMVEAWLTGCSFFSVQKVHSLRGPHAQLPCPALLCLLPPLT